MSDGKRYVVAVYELDRVMGGPEEGGWWYDTGDLVRVLRVVRSEDHAFALCRRVNGLLSHRRDVYPGEYGYPLSSVCYTGGHLAAQVFEGTAPEHFPSQRPHYE